ncbi:MULTISPECIES: helix-turn-helix transcriptional regulator [unclassified Facklamia]|uniref:helix-turn-helix domain-containing protein n=1 Tax=Aerococcaceae TaxID=186827 RepID=UPI0013B9869A|nr:MULTISPECIES: helix-turn-helix transcriptional regulator [unclassified Facklamia]NEW65306.1 helix-turn-helix domain-containing protein [Facklamia sp. 252]NEW68794.1 helix-turn-helix domain-containing protein [Facklamia sp. 253]QQD66105.1 helix-turn-helix transcriptional regulator [Aerococcaceae bacterium zg-252]
MSFAQKIKSIRIEKGLNQDEFASALNSFAEKSNGLYSSNFNKTNISKWENGKVEPRMDTIRLIASTFDIEPNELLGIQQPYYTLTEKEKLDIGKEVDKLLEGMFTKSEVNFYGEPLTDEGKEQLRIAIQMAMELNKEKAKKKFTPKKYRNE